MPKFISRLHGDFDPRRSLFSFARSPFPLSLTATRWTGRWWWTPPRLEKGDVTRVLKWSAPPMRQKSGRPSADPRRRVKGPDARELADRYFFETLVRVHAQARAPPHGPEPAGEIPPGIALGDRRSRRVPLRTSSGADGALDGGLEGAFRRGRGGQEARRGKRREGREYVEAYVVYIHYVEGLVNAIHEPAHHEAEPENAGAPSSCGIRGNYYLVHERKEIVMTETLKPVVAQLQESFQFAERAS